MRDHGDSYEHDHVEVHLPYQLVKDAEREAGSYRHLDDLAREHAKVPNGWEEDPHGVWRMNHAPRNDGYLVQMPVRRRKRRA